MSSITIPGDMKLVGFTEETRKRLDSAKKMECPDCKSPLQKVSAKLMSSGYKDDDVARKCTACKFICHIGDKKEGSDGKNKKPGGIQA